MRDALQTRLEQMERINSSENIHPSNIAKRILDRLVLYFRGTFRNVEEHSGNSSDNNSPRQYLSDYAIQSYPWMENRTYLRGWKRDFMD